MAGIRSRRWLRAGALVVAFLFVAGEALARGGRGGGGRGGGGRSISRASPAAGGMGSMQRSRSPQMRSRTQRPSTMNRASVSSRPSTGSLDRPSAGTRPSAGSRPAARPGAGGEGQRPAQRPSGGAGDRQQSAADRQTQRQEAASDRIDQHDQNRDENREDWQDWSNDRMEDRQDAWDDVEWDHVHIYDDDDFEWNTGAWMAITIGTAVTVAAFSSMQQQQGCNLFQTEVDGTTYYKCGNTWYIEAVTGGNVQYVAVAPPPGF